MIQFLTRSSGMLCLCLTTVAVFATGIPDSRLQELKDAVSPSSLCVGSPSASQCEEIVGAAVQHCARGLQSPPSGAAVAASDPRAPSSAIGPESKGTTIGGQEYDTLLTLTQAEAELAYQDCIGNAIAIAFLTDTASVDALQADQNNPIVYAPVIVVQPNASPSPPANDVREDAPTQISPPPGY